MATYRGDEIPVPPQPETDLQQAGPPLPGLENVEEELNLPEQAGPDYTPMPGDKNYLKTKPVAEEYGKVPLSHYGSPRIPSQSFNPNASGYDHPTLEVEDMQHDTRVDPVDGQLHNPSRVPRTGMLLKGRNHPTFDLSVEEDRKLGYGLEMRDGRYYTQPFEQPKTKHGSSTVIKSKDKFDAP